MNKMNDELFDLPVDPVSDMSPEQHLATAQLHVDAQTLAVTIRAKVEASLLFKETKDGDIDIVGINPQVATNELLPEIPIVAHTSLGYPYEYNQQTGLWKKITAPLRTYVDSKYLENWFFNESMNPQVYLQRKHLASDFAERLALQGEDTPITTNPNPNAILFKNGSYNFITNRIEAPKREDYHTLQLDYELIEDNSESRIEQWLEWILGDSKQTLMELIGYCFYRDYKYQALIYLVNDPKTLSGSNGKSRVIDMMNRVFSGKHATHVRLKDLTNPNNRFSMASLEGKLANIESDSGVEELEETGNIKSLTGGDEILVELKGKDPHSMKNYAKMFVSTNKLPSFKDDSNGMRRRLYVIPFLKTFTDASPELQAEVAMWNKEPFRNEHMNADDQLGHFAYRCIQEFRKILQDPALSSLERPFYESEDAKQIRGDYAERNNILTQFLEYSGLEITNNPKDRVANVDLKSLFEAWQYEEGSKYALKTIKNKLRENGVVFKSNQVKLFNGTAKNVQCANGLRDTLNRVDMKVGIDE